MKTKVKLSMIIPALNEEKYLPGLISSIKKQNFKENYEIIVADAKSDDGTARIARALGCRVVSVRRGIPSYARNDAAKKAEGEILLFLDADGILPKNFLREGLEKFERKKLDVAGCYVLPDSKNILDWLMWVALADAWFFTVQLVNPEGFGAGIFCKKKVFNKLGGFDERITFGEDCEFIKRSKKAGMKFRLLNLFIKTSMRRAHGRNRIIVFWDYIKLNFNRMVLMKKKVKYDFGKSHIQ